MPNRCIAPASDSPTKASYSAVNRSKVRQRITAAALYGLKRIYRAGYKKAGLMLMELDPATTR
jgi:hypothetical protein